MPYGLRQWPGNVYASFAEKLPGAVADLDAALLEMSRQGPAPVGYHVKNLGKSKNGLWQLNFKSEGIQIRILYAPYKDRIVVFCIHKKSSPQEQQRAYSLAMKRKSEAEKIVSNGTIPYERFPTIH